MAHGGVEANGVGNGGGGGVKEKSSSVDEDGPKERIWEGDLGEDEKRVGVGGDAVDGKAAKEVGHKKVAVMKAEAEDAAMVLTELAGVGGSIEGGGEEGRKSRAREERGREGGGGEEKGPIRSIGPGGDSEGVRNHHARQIGAGGFLAGERFWVYRRGLDRGCTQSSIELNMGLVQLTI